MVAVSPTILSEVYTGRCISVQMPSNSAQTKLPASSLLQRGEADSPNLTTSDEILIVPLLLPVTAI